MKHLVIINGCAGSGKDELAKIFKQKSVRKIYNVSSVGYIKEIAIKYFGWNGIKDEAGRQLLSELKNSTTKYNNLPLRILEDHLNKADEGSTTFWHCREPEEIQKAYEALRDSYYVITVFVSRPEVEKNIAAGNVDALSDMSIYDMIIENGGTLEEYHKTIGILVDQHDEHFDNILNYNNQLSDE